MPIYSPSDQVNFGTSRTPGSSALQRQAVNLTGAQLVQLDGTAVTLVQAPGSGFMLMPIAAMVSVYAGANATTDGGGNIQFNVGTRLYNLASGALTCGAGNNTHAYYVFPNAQSTSGAPPTDENAALTLNKAGNNVANVGNTSTCSVEIFYRTISISPVPVTA